MSQSRQVIVGRTRMHYLLWGDTSAPTVVFLHGGGLNAHTWDSVCTSLSSQFRCIAVDLRGHGDSEWSPDADYRVEVLAEDLHGLVRELHLRSFALVGHSLGAFVGLRYAALHPAAVVGYVAVDASPFVRNESLARRIVSFIVAKDSFGDLDEAVAHARTLRPDRDRASLRRGVERNVRRRYDGQWMWKYDRRHLVEHGVEARIADVRRLVPDARRVRCPVLLIRGSEGLRSEEAEEFASTLADCRIVTIDGAGHNVHADAPDAFIDATRPFLASLPHAGVGAR